MLPDAASPLDHRATLAEVEAHILNQAMAATRHNQRAAARHLGLSYDQLRNRLRKHGLIGAA